VAAAEGALKERVVRCPLPAADGASVEGDLEGLWPCVGDFWRCSAVPMAGFREWYGDSLEVDDDDDELPGEPAGLATFLNVMVHLTSSPAKTVWSCQRTKTRMLP
jgi:hypothetical protein